MLINNKDEFLARIGGSGLDLSNIFVNGKINICSGTRKITQNIASLLQTLPLSRVLMPSLGCNLRQYLQLGNIFIIQDLVSEAIKDVVRLYEPRVVVTNVVMTQVENKLNVRLFYKIQNSNINLTYDYIIQDNLSSLSS